MIPWLFFLVLGMTVFPVRKVEAIPITLIMEVIKKAVVKVIQAIDLKIQRLQNQTIWLQNAQKVLENKLNELKLSEIADWNDKQKEQYASLFKEFWKVKSAIIQFQRLKEVIEMQKMLVKEYKNAWGLISSSNQYSSQELISMERNYEGILRISLQNLDELSQVMNPFRIQMTDAERLAFLHQSEKKLRENLYELRSYNSMNLNLMKSRGAKGEEFARNVYGIEK